MIEFPQLTDGNVRWLWPMRKRMEKRLTVRGWQIHKFPDVGHWGRPQSKAAGGSGEVKHY